MCGRGTRPIAGGGLSIEPQQDRNQDWLQHKEPPRIPHRLDRHIHALVRPCNYLCGVTKDQASLLGKYREHEIHRDGGQLEYDAAACVHHVAKSEAIEET